MTFSVADKRREAERELAQRRHVYPRLVAAGKLTQTKADHQIAVMTAIAADYAEPDLFAPGAGVERTA